MLPTTTTTTKQYNIHCNNISSVHNPKHFISTEKESTHFSYWGTRLETFEDTNRASAPP